MNQIDLMDRKKSYDETTKLDASFSATPHPFINKTIDTT